MHSPVAMIVSMLLLICAFVIDCFVSSNTVILNQPCTSPVSYNITTSIVIHGPCPNGTYIIPIHSIAEQFRCDYADRNGSFKLQFWRVSLIESNVIFPGQEIKDSLRVSANTNDESGYTILTINTNELSTSYQPTAPITVQCGICLSITDCNQNPLEKGIISGNSTLIIFGN